MASVLEELTLETVAELLNSLGNIPPERIPLRQPLGSATEKDVLRLLEAPRKRICELVDGVLVEKNMGFYESYLAGLLIELLNAYVRSRGLGVVASPDGTISLWPGRVRIPDIAFYSWNNLPEGKLPREPIPEIVPNLAIEILSRSNTEQEMRLKRQDYFQVGVQLVWVINPQTQTVAIYTQVDPPDCILTTQDTLTGGTVLPEFSLQIGEFFATITKHEQSAKK
jgi:Uma2 family endonuclease